MAESIPQGGYGRLEDFIAFARTGAVLTATVDLEKQLVTQKVHPGDHPEMKTEIDLWLYVATFTFLVGKEQRMVSKVYMYSAAAESADQAHIDAHIANERLDSDYRRLKEATIQVAERFFEQDAWFGSHGTEVSRGANLWQAGKRV